MIPQFYLVNPAMTDGMRQKEVIQSSTLRISSIALEVEGEDFSHWILKRSVMLSLRLSGRSSRRCSLQVWAHRCHFHVLRRSRRLSPRSVLQAWLLQIVSSWCCRSLQKLGRAIMVSSLSRLLAGTSLRRVRCPGAFRSR